MALSFDKVNRIITVPAPTTEVSVQTLINEIRDWEDNLENLDVPKVADASGKESLGGGLAVGITLKLLNWKVKFEDRPGPDWVDCGVSGGNILAVDADGQDMNPIAPSAYVTVTKSTAVSAALVAEWKQTDIDNLFGSVNRILGLSQENFYIDEAEYDGAGRLVQARIRTFPTAEDVPDGTPIAIYRTISTYKPAGLATYKVIRET